MTENRKAHWDGVYGATTENQLSWHKDDPQVSLDFVRIAGATEQSSVIDIGGGTSRFVGSLLAMGLRDVTILELSRVALDASRDRLGAKGDTVTWIAADITRRAPDRTYDLWHDRAVFHFLVDPAERAAYLRSLVQGVRVGGHAIIATFAPDGPEKCSGLPVARYSPQDIAALVSENFDMVTHRHHLHQTPSGKGQSFQFSLLRRTR